jgi:hypothetical protein
MRGRIAVGARHRHVAVAPMRGRVAVGAWHCHVDPAQSLARWPAGIGQDQEHLPAEMGGAGGVSAIFRPARQAHPALDAVTGDIGLGPSGVL